MFETRHGQGPNLREQGFTKFINNALYAGFGYGRPGFDPLALDLDGDGLELTSQSVSNVYFEFDNDGFAERSGWVRGDDGLLAIDLNANGKIDDITELFGNQTTSGFVMLSVRDVHADRVIELIGSEANDNVAICLAA